MVYSVFTMGRSIDVRRLLVRLAGPQGREPLEPGAPVMGDAVRATAAVDPGEEPSDGPGSEAARLPGPPQTALQRILRGDRPVLERVALDLAGPDPALAARWRRLLEELVEAILLAALEAGVVYPAPAHPFWGRFTPSQGRQILDALAQMGFRFDGLGGWVDGRAPVKRDLVVAIGYVGADPVRIRAWPGPAEMADLVRDATIDGDEYLHAVAPTLALADLAVALGPRALPLAELWLNLERVRPLLLAAS
jgi:hypothetical protein